MGFSSVFKSLQEIFPEVDARLLRAVAIEHPKDADHAVEVVLTEVLPYISKHSNSSSSPENLGSRDPLDEGGNVSHGNQGSRDSLDEGGNEEDLEPHDLLTRRREHRSLSSEDNQVFMPMPKYNEDSSDSNLTGANNVGSTSLDITCNDHSVLDEVDKSISFGEAKMNEDFVLDHVASVDQHQVSVNTLSNRECGTEETGDLNASICVHEDENATKLNNLNLEDFDGPGVRDIAVHQLESCLVNSHMAENHVFEQPTSSVEGILDTPKSSLQIDSQSLISDCEKGSLCFNSYQDCLDSGLVDIDDDSALARRSGQICSVDSLEEIIEDAKYSKQTLASAKESVINMMKRVELQEKAAEQAREEAAKGGSDILIKVEELKKMLVHAKEANDMHAGEVYGEKAILATEARELQSRLLSLSQERDISLAILNDMRESLETRLSVAEEAMKAALLEKEAKEALAQSALAEQEAIMAKVVQESKILQQEAEENSKLQEFLMDRGRVVDMLQGEISVICQDVRFLKEKFDKRLPLSQSLTSSQTTCILASSGSSLKSVASDLDIDLSLSKTLKKTSPTTSITNGESPKSSTTSVINGESAKGSDEDGVKNVRTALLEDEWYLFDGVEDFVSGMMSK